MFNDGTKVQVCPPIKMISTGDDGMISYRDFKLYDCSGNIEIFNDESYNNSTIEFNNDTLTIGLQINLPIGKDRETKSVTQSTTKLFRYNGKFIKRVYVNKFRKYTRKEIKQTLREFRAGPKALDEDIENLIAKLFVAALSDNEAYQHFINFDNEFMELDGGAMEDYRDFKAMLEERK